MLLRKFRASALCGHSHSRVATRPRRPSNSSFAGRNFSPPFCSSLHQARKFKGEREERGDCAFDSALFRGILRSNVVLRGRKPCDGRCARVRHVMGRETFLIHLLSTLFLSPSPTPPTNKQPRMSLTQRLPAEYETFSARRLPQSLTLRRRRAPLPFLSMLAALFVPPLGDEARAMRRPSFTWCGDGEGRRT